MYGKSLKPPQAVCRKFEEVEAWMRHRRLPKLTQKKIRYDSSKPPLIMHVQAPSALAYTDALHVLLNSKEIVRDGCRFTLLLYFWYNAMNQTCSNLFLQVALSCVVCLLALSYNSFMQLPCFRFDRTHHKV